MNIETKVVKLVFGCGLCKGLFEDRLSVFTVQFEGNNIDVCKICDRKLEEEENKTHCNVCGIKADNMKRIRDPDTKKMSNVCESCYKEIKPSKSSK